MARWSKLFTPIKGHDSKKDIGPFFHPCIIDDILSGILSVQKDYTKGFAWKLKNENIPSLMNYEKVINQTEVESPTASSTGSATTPVEPLCQALFHKDWNHIADILLHQYEQYLSLLSKMASKKGDLNFFPTIMYPLLSDNPGRLKNHEWEILRLSLSDTSWLIPKSHLFFYRDNSLWKIPLTFSACMKAYFKGGDMLCPKWSMEKVHYDVYYDVKCFMLNVQFVQQPFGSRLCGVCSINNITQGETVVNRVVKSQERTEVYTPGFPICLTQFGKVTAAEIRNDHLVTEEDFKLMHNVPSNTRKTDTFLHSEKDGTNFVLVVRALDLAQFPTATLMIGSDPDVNIQRLKEIKEDEGWLFQYYDIVLSTVAHMGSIPRGV